MKKYHKVSDINFTNESLKIGIDGKYYEFKLSAISERLANASDIEREKYEISPSGYGIHWPLIDEDLSIDGFLGIKHSPTKIKVVAQLR
jgi:hypothetical protein